MYNCSTDLILIKVDELGCNQVGLDVVVILSQPISVAALNAGQHFSKP